MKIHKTLTPWAAALLLASTAWPALAEVSTVRLAKQFGIGYLPLTLVEELDLLEKHAAASGHEITTEWLRFTGGSGMNEALLSGNLDLAAGGTGPLFTIWARTRENLKIKGVAALASMPLHLMTSNPEVKTLADFGQGDKIALPAVKTSIQAVTLQMASKQAFGADKATAMDAFTVSMGHPDAQLALTGGQSEVTAHFGSPPFQNLEAKVEGIHKVLDSYDVLGGSHTFTVVWAADKFISENPEITKAFMAALEESMELIRTDPEKAAEIWMAAERSPLSREEVVALIQDEQTVWTTTPERTLPYVEFLSKSGLIKTSAEDWSEIFFDTMSGKEGS